MSSKGIRTLVLENAIAPKPLKARDLARAHNVSVYSIYRVTTRLRAEGHLPKSKQTLVSGKVYSPASATGRALPKVPTKGYVPVPGPAQVVPKDLSPSMGRTWTPADVEAIVNSTVMPELERLQKLSNMARFGPDAISIAAIKSLEDLGRARGQTVGPGKPLTLPEQVTRLSRLLTAVGRKVADLAFRVAFDPKPRPEATLEAPEGILEGTNHPPEASEPELEALDALPQETSQEHSGPTPSDSSVG